jgi:hypothetical protein
MPAQTQQLLTDQLHQLVEASSGTLGIGAGSGSVLALWSASRGMAASSPPSISPTRKRSAVASSNSMRKRKSRPGRVLGQNPPELAYWERGEWWLAGDARPWQPDAVNVLSDKLVFRPRLTPVAGCATPGTRDGSDE